MTKNGERHFEVIDEECVACNLCIEVCPVENCITMVQLTEGVDPRTGKQDRSGATPTGRRIRTIRTR